ncbi:S8 family serine peptidase [Neptuniibacter sp. QD29_5]|uniref:S8 family serine peptidase n=1 Tax=Neptuniibacter sp. QD29_5 TaxID=3398207 RepID=UPI0039F47A9B
MKTPLKLLCVAIGCSLAASFAVAGIEFRPGEVVVKGEVSASEGYEVLKYLPNADLTILKVSPGKELTQTLALRSKGRKASRNYIARKFAPNDPFYGYQWHFGAVQAEQAWAHYDGAGVNVAVLDTGLQSGGPDGIDCVLPGYNAIDGSANVADGDGHGTHVSGTVAQSTDNGVGVAGLAHGACILPVKVLDDSGSGTDADIAEGIAWAINNGAQVINMSLGYPAGYALEQFVNYPSYSTLTNSDTSVTIVVASGNDSSTDGISYPASHPETLAVGATDVDGIAPYSNQGPKLDIVAPGGNTSQNLHIPNDSYGDGVVQETYIWSQGQSSWGYYLFQGTSMAAPHAAAAAAILLSKDGSLNRYQVQAALEASAADLGDSGWDSVFGHGLIQVYDALGAIEAGDNEPIDDEPTETKPGSPENFSASFDANAGVVELTWSAPSQGTVTSYAIERSKQNKRGKLGGFSTVATPIGTETSYSDEGLDSGTYVYRILARNSAGASAWVLSNSVEVTTSGGGSGGSDGECKGGWRKCGG